MSKSIISENKKRPVKDKNIHRFHPARLLYLFTVILLINVFWSEIQAILASGPSAVFDLNKLNQTFIGQIAKTYPQIFWFTVGLSLAATPLGWYLEKLYNSRVEERRNKEIEQKTRAIIQEDRDDKVALIQANELHCENFNLGDDTAANFQYITEPIQDVYNTATHALHNIDTGIKIEKRGLLFIGEASAGKSRLAFEVLRRTLPNWLVLQWSPGNSVSAIPTRTVLNKQDIVLFIDDLQKYISSEQRIEILHTLMRRLRETAKQVVVIATCRLEDELLVNAHFGNFFEELQEIRLRRFSQNTQEAETLSIITEFEKAGAKHTKDWDGTLGSLVLGLSRKRSLYTDLVTHHDPAAIVLRAMKLLTQANITVNTEQRIQHVCAEVFGEKELQQSEKVWRIAIIQLKQLQFVTVDKYNSNTALTIRKDDYFEKVMIDYPQAEIEQDFETLQRVLVELKDAEALVDLSSSYLRLKQFLKSLKALDEALVLNPTSDSTWYLKGCILGILKRPEEALDIFKKALALNPNYSLAWKMQGITLFILEQYEDSLVSLEHALSLNSNDADVYFHKGRTLNSLKRYDEALVVLEQALSLDSNHSRAWLEKGRTLNSLKRYNEALIAFERASSLDASDTEAQYLKGLLLIILERPFEALIAFEKATSLNPNYANTWSLKGIVLNTLERYDEALVALEQALSLDPNHAPTWREKGIILNNLERFNEALVALEQALFLDASDAEVWFFKGRTLHMLERFEEALTAFEQAVLLDPKNSNTWYFKGHALFAQKRFKEALADFDQAVTLDSHNAEAWFLKGLTLNILEQPLEALAALEQALVLNPNKATLWQQKAEILRILGRKSEAQIAEAKAKKVATSKTV